MEKQAVLTLIQQILNRPEPVGFDDSPATLKEWDSLAQLQILSGLDEGTGGKASSIPELGNALSVAAILQALERNGLLDG